MMAFRCNPEAPEAPEAIPDERHKAIPNERHEAIPDEFQTQVVPLQQPSNMILAACNMFKGIVDQFPTASTIAIVTKWKQLNSEVINIAAPQKFAIFLADVFEELLKQQLVNPIFMAKVMKILALFMGVFEKISCNMSGDELLNLLRTDEKVLPDPNLVSQAYAALTRTKYHHMLPQKFTIAVTNTYFMIYDQVYLRKCPVVPQPDYDNTKVVVQEMDKAEENMYFYIVLIFWRMFPGLPREKNCRVIQTVLRHCGPFKEHNKIVPKDIWKAVENEKVKKMEDQKEKNIKKFKGLLKTFFKNGDITKLECAVFQRLDAQHGGMNFRKSNKKKRRYNLSDIAKWFHYVWWKDSSSLVLRDIIWINGATRLQLERWFQLNWRKILWTKMLNAVRNKMSQSS